jgi:hypothetical protein
MKKSSLEEKLQKELKVPEESEAVQRSPPARKTIAHPALSVWRVPCSAEKRNMCTLASYRAQDEEAVLCMNFVPSYPVPRSTRGTGVFYRLLSKRRQLSVQRVAPRNRRSQFPIESKEY